MFNVLTNRLEISGTLHLETALRIGAGRALEPDATDLPVIKDGFGRPYIPGSSFKGVLRTYAESLLRAIAPNPEFVQKLACNPLSEDARQSFRRCLTNSEVRELKGNDEDLVYGTCLACRLFGAQWLASPLQIRDLLIDKQFLYNERYSHYEVRNGVAINRDTETAADGMLYDFEAVPAGVTFQFKALVENAEPELLGLFFLALRAFEEGRKALGGATSRGLGGVRLEWTGTYLDFKNLGKSKPEERLDVIVGYLTGEQSGLTIRPGDQKLKEWAKSLRDEIAQMELE
ncbi:MAG: CRISPR-associated RAMP protein [Chloroflexi bacterium]|nr:CRISPR-associated RAMP protein [Chloroflexota bacterium]